MKRFLFVLWLLGAVALTGTRAEEKKAAPPKPTPSVIMSGMVGNPGRVFFPPERIFTIVDAISLAGGPTRMADLQHVKLTRTNAQGESVVTVIDVNALMRQGKPEDYPRLEAGDAVYLPDRSACEF